MIRQPTWYWRIWWWFGYHGLYQINWWWKDYIQRIECAVEGFTKGKK